MSVSVGKSYHIKDSFFSLVNDSKLMVNKEGNNYRPHFFFFEDTKTKGIYWAVPQSTKIAKYQAIIQQKIAKYDKCNTIVIGNFGGQDNAFLIQNMFPIIEKYVDHEHTINGLGVNIHSTLSASIISNAKEVLSLHDRGYKLVFPNINNIYSFRILSPSNVDADYFSGIQLQIAHSNNNINQIYFDVSVVSEGDVTVDKIYLWIYN